MKFFSLDFWFNYRPGPLLPFYANTLTGIIIVFIVLAIVFFLLKKKKGFYFKLQDKLFLFFSTNAFFALVLWFFNSELLPFFSSRFWYLLWAISMIVWLVFIFRYLNSLPQKKKEIEEKKNYTKYIP